MWQSELAHHLLLSKPNHWDSDYFLTIFVIANMLVVNGQRRLWMGNLQGLNVRLPFEKLFRVKITPLLELSRSFLLRGSVTVFIPSDPLMDFSPLLFCFQFSASSSLFRLQMFFYFLQPFRSWSSSSYFCFGVLL